MNMHSIINMVMRQVMRRGVNSAFKKSDQLLSRTRQRPDPLADRERALQEREDALAQMDREDALRQREEEIARREAELRNR